MRAPYSYRDDPSVPSFPDDRPLMVFDGHCGVCSGWARVVLGHDRNGVFRLTPATSNLGEALYRHYGLDPDLTYLVIEDGEGFGKAEASLRIVRRLGLPWSAAGVLRILPIRWLDGIYDWVARNRYRFAGRKQACMMPSPEQRGRFL
jgi:predicted DCC family thiol-disulfide oxidoreductase YuxK